MVVVLRLRLRVVSSGHPASVETYVSPLLVGIGVVLTDACARENLFFASVAYVGLYGGET